MSRIQIALNVSDLNAAIAFYSKLFGSDPTKQRPGYANFAIFQPPLKLVLIENAEARESLNHLGIEVESTAEVSSASTQLTNLGLETKPESNVTCCYALQDKVWVQDPDDVSWEIYTVVADSAVRDLKPAQAVTKKVPSQECCQPSCCQTAV